MSEEKLKNTVVFGLKIEKVLHDAYRAMPFAERKRLADSLRAEILVAVSTYKQSNLQNLAVKSQKV